MVDQVEINQEVHSNINNITSCSFTFVSVMDASAQPSFDDLTEKLKLALASNKPQLVYQFINSDNGTILLLQWKLLANLRKRSCGDVGLLLDRQHNKHRKEIQWILNDRRVLELLICSGYVQEHRWMKVIELLSKILATDSEAKTGYKLRLAVAVSLTFSTPVKSLADQTVEIDGLKRYKSYVSWAEAGKLFHPFKYLTAWELRYVVGSWAEDDELLWARENVPAEFKTASKIGEATHSMMKYKETNCKGVSVHDGASYYENRAVTMAVLHEVGAVCGGISKFGCGMSQAFGIPAMPVGQPGHCAFLWWNEGKWTLSNDVAGLDRSVVHDGIQWTWNTNAEYVILMEQSQQNFKDFVTSEKIRIAVKFCGKSVALELLDTATGTCASNYLLWRDLAKICTNFNAQEDSSTWVLNAIRALDYFNQTGASVTEAISKNAIVRVSDCHERGPNIVNGTGSEWWTDEETGWVEIDLGSDCIVAGVKIQWWGTSVSKNYVLYAAHKDGTYMEIKRTIDEVASPKGYNGWSQLDGWTMKTAKVRIDLMDGSLDPWGFGKWFGIRQVLILGREERKSEILSKNKAVKVSECHERGHNLTDGTASEWWAEGKEAWIEIKLGQLCYVEHVKLQWWGSSVAKEVSLLFSTDGKIFESCKLKTLASDLKLNRWISFPIQLVASDVRLELKHGTQDPWGMKKNFGLRNVLVLGEKILVKNVLIKKAKQLLPQWARVEKDVCKMLQEADLQVLSHMAKCRTSDCEERAQNIVDGTQSEWWTENQEAWVEIELESECIIHGLKIQWWGTSVSKDLRIYVINEHGKAFPVKASADEIASPKDYNDWSVFNGWDAKTKTIKLELKNGSLDPWGMGKYFGIRQVIVTGVKCT